MRTLLFLLLSILSGPCILQAQDTLFVNDKATLHLQCSGNIIYCDLGCDIIKAAIAPNVPSLLRIKASSPFDQTTTLSVMTDRENFTTYIVKYKENISEYIVSQAKQNHREESFLEYKEEGGETSLIAKINASKPMLNHIFSSTLKIDFNINSIYTADDKVYITVSIINRSSISYKADATFILADIDHNHSTAQDIVIIPDGRHGSLEAVAGKATTATYSFNKLTVSENKRLQINLYEIDGYRNVTLKIDSKDIANAKPFIQ